MKLKFFRNAGSVSGMVGRQPRDGWRVAGWVLQAKDALRNVTMPGAPPRPLRDVR